MMWSVPPPPSSTLERHCLVCEQHVNNVRFAPPSLHLSLSSLSPPSPLFSIPQTFSWKDLAFPLLSEALDRNFLWAVKKDGSLLKGRPEGSLGPDFDYLARSFEAQKVALRIWMFHATVMSVVIRPAGVPLAAIARRHDLLYVVLVARVPWSAKVEGGGGGREVASPPPPVVGPIALVHSLCTCVTRAHVGNGVLQNGHRHNAMPCSVCTTAGAAIPPARAPPKLWVLLHVPTIHCCAAGMAWHPWRSSSGSSRRWRGSWRWTRGQSSSSTWASPAPPRTH
jgi:hypothetical protein